MPDDIRYLPVADDSYQHLHSGNPDEQNDVMPGVKANHFAARESKSNTAAVELADLKLTIADVKVGIASDIAGLKSDLAEIRGMLDNMPTTFQIRAWFLGVAIGLTALVFAIARVVR